MDKNIFLSYPRKENHFKNFIPLIRSNFYPFLTIPTQNLTPRPIKITQKSNRE